MFERLIDAAALLREVVAAPSVQEADAPEAIRLFDAFAELERLAAAGRMVAGRRIEETKAWHGSGFQKLSAGRATRRPRRTVFDGRGGSY